MGGLSTSHLAALPPQRSGNHYTEAAWSSGSITTGADNLAPTGVRKPDLPSVSTRYADCAIPAAPYSGGEGKVKCTEEQAVKTQRVEET